jgi:NADH-quinone oxidoreductase subunit L
MSTGPLAALLAVALPALSALLLAVAWPLRRKVAAFTTISIGAATASLVASIVALLSPPQEIAVPWLMNAGHPYVTAGVHLDGISGVMLVVVSLVALMVQIFSIGYLHDEPGPSLGRYFTYQSLFLFSMQLLVIAPNLLQLFVGWELVGATSYLLIGFWYRKPSAARAAMKAFWVTKLADTGLLLALVVLVRTTGGFDWTTPLDGSTATMVTLLLVLAVAGKSAQFPLHIWLPDAMEGPTPVSALLHAATMVAAGVFLIVRAYPLFEQSPDARHVLAYLGSGTALFAAFLALVQTDLKKVLAYSTCSQLGYMLAGLGAGSQMAGYFHLGTHAFFKALLFLAAGSVIHAVHSNDLTRMGGLAQRMPFTATVFIIGALCLAGIPGSSGFFSKDLILEELAGNRLWVPLSALLLGAFLTALYVGRVVLLAFFGPESEAAEHAHEAGWSMKGPLALLAAMSLVSGVSGGWFAGHIGADYEFRIDGTGILAMLLAFAGVGSAWAIWGRSRVLNPGPLGALAAFADRAWVNRAWLWGYRRVLLILAGVVAWVDRYIIDALINAVGAVFLLGTRRLRTVQTGNVQDYLYAVSVGVIALVWWGLLR